MEQKENKILIHCCCAICSAYSILSLKNQGYEPIAYFYNPNIDTEDEYNRRLNAQKTLCNYHNIELFYEKYDPNDYLKPIAGYEDEPEQGMRCDKCIELRLAKTVNKAKELNISKITTSLVISPHKNFSKISFIGENLCKNTEIEYISIDFKKKDGFLKTNKISKELGLYRQNYCGCKFAKKHLEK